MLSRPTYLGIYGRRLFLVLTALSIILTGCLGLLGYLNAKKTITQNAKLHLWGIAKERSEQIKMWFDEQSKIVKTLSELRLFRETVAKLSAFEGNNEESRKKLEEIFCLHHKVYNVSLGYELYNTNLRRFFTYYPDTIVVAPELVKDQLTKSLSSEGPVWGSLYLLKPGTAVLDLMIRVRSSTDSTANVFVVKLDPKVSLNKILSSAEGLGSTGETYLIGADTTMLTPSRHENHPYPLTHKMFTEGILHCLAGKDSTELYEGYNGQKLLGAYIWLPEQKWALMAEMHAEEAFAPLYQTSIHFLLVLGAGMTAVLVISIFISRRLTHPIYTLVDATNKVAQGDFTTVLPNERNDEIGDLTRQFNAMVASLQKSRAQLEGTLMKLAQAQKMAAIGQLVASTVHEMRNPLSTIKMNLRILEKKGNLDEDKLEHLKLAAEQVLRLEIMLNELLEYSKPVKPKLTSFELSPLLQKIMSSKSKVLEEKGLVGKLKLPEEAVVIYSDADLLTRILDNLISNAINASHSSQSITITLLNRGEITLAVEDTGMGMSPEVIARIYEPFFTTHKEGIGLGMCNVKKFVDALEGKIEIESEENRGTKVYLRLKS